MSTSEKVRLQKAALATADKLVLQEWELYVVSCLQLPVLFHLCPYLSTKNNNGYIITWMLHQIIMISDVKLKAGSSIPFTSSHHLPYYWTTNWQINYVHVSNLNWRKFLPCHNIHVLFYPLEYYWHGQLVKDFSHAVR